MAEIDLLLGKDLAQLDAEIARLHITPSLEHKRVALEIQRGLLSKLLWNRRSFPLVAETISQSGRKSGVDELLAAVYGQVRQGRVFAVEATNDHRVLRHRSDVRRDLEFLLRGLEANPRLLPEGTSAEAVRQRVDQAFAVFQGEDVYTNPGVRGALALFDDAFIVEGRQSDAHRQSEAKWAAEALHAAAQAMELHSLEKDYPSEVKLLFAQYAKLERSFAELRERGVEVHLERLKETPEDLLEAVARISVATQHNYVQEWLTPLVLEGRRPRATVSTDGETRLKEMGLGEAKYDEVAARRDVASVERAASRFLRFASHSPNLDRPAQAAITELNRAMQEIARRYTLRRLVFDNANDRTHDAQDTIRKMMVIGPIAHGLELLDMGPAAKLFAASTDDLLGEWAEIQALLGSGFSRREVLKRLRIAVPVFGLATYGATRVDHLLDAGQELQAGALFGASAVALSLTTAIQSVGMYKKAYDALLAEGKIAGKVAPLTENAAFQQMLREWQRAGTLLDRSRRPELLTLVRTQLESMRGQSGPWGTLSPGEIDKIVTELERADFTKLQQMVTRPGSLERWKAAVIQDFSNPARLGLLIGSATAPIAGMAAAALGGMHNGMVLAAIGSVEGLVAGASVLAARALNDWQYRFEIERELKAAISGSKN